MAPDDDDDVDDDVDDDGVDLLMLMSDAGFFCSRTILLGGPSLLCSAMCRFFEKRSLFALGCWHAGGGGVRRRNATLNSAVGAEQN